MTDPIIPVNPIRKNMAAGARPHMLQGVSTNKLLAAKALLEIRMNQLLIKEETAKTEADNSPIFSQMVADTGWNPLDGEQSPGEKEEVLRQVEAEDLKKKQRKDQRLKAEAGRRKNSRRNR